MIAQKLGNEDAALYRFTHPVKPDQPLVPAPKPALSDTVVERDPLQKASQHRSQLPLSQEALPQAGALQPPLQQSRDKVEGGVGSASHAPRKGTKAAPQYAAGNAKNPIMLAEIKVGTAVCHSTEALCSLDMHSISMASQSKIKVDNAKANSDEVDNPCFFDNRISAQMLATSMCSRAAGVSICIACRCTETMSKFVAPSSIQNLVSTLLLPTGEGPFSR